MNVSYLHEKTFLDQLQTRWARWQQHKRFYPSNVLWWGRYVKRLVLHLFTSEGTNRRQHRQTPENFYYDAIYTALQDATVTDTTYVTLKEMTAKIVRLHLEPHQRLFVDTEGQDNGVDETPKLYHIVRQVKRQEFKMVDRVYDSEGNLQTPPLTVLRAFMGFTKNKYDTITVDKDSFDRMLRRTSIIVPHIANVALDRPITMEELHIAVRQGKKLKRQDMMGYAMIFPNHTGDNQR